MTQLPAFFEEDLTHMLAGDLDGMMANYHPDVQVMRLPDTVAKGKDEVRAFFADYLAMNPDVVEVMAAQQQDNCILYHSIIKINGERHGLVGTWVLRDGLIWRQTSVVYPLS